MGSKKLTENCLRNIESRICARKIKDSPLNCQKSNPHYLNVKKKLFLEQRSEETFHKQRLLDYKIHHFSIQDSKRLPALLVKQENNHIHIKPPKLAEISSKSHSTVSAKSEKKAKNSLLKAYGPNDNELYIPIDNRVKITNLTLESEFRELMGVKKHKNERKLVAKSNDQVTNHSTFHDEKQNEKSTAKTNVSEEVKNDVSKSPKKKSDEKVRLNDHLEEMSLTSDTGKRKLKTPSNKVSNNAKQVRSAKKSDKKVNTENAKNSEESSVCVNITTIQSSEDDKSSRAGELDAKLPRKIDSEDVKESVLTEKNEEIVSSEDPENSNFRTQSTEEKSEKANSKNFVSLDNGISPNEQETGKMGTGSTAENLDKKTEHINDGDSEENKHWNKVLRHNGLSNVSECTIIFHADNSHGKENGEKNLGKCLMDNQKVDESHNSHVGTQLRDNKYLEVDTTSVSSRLTTPGPLRGNSACFPEC